MPVMDGIEAMVEIRKILMCRSYFTAKSEGHRQGTSGSRSEHDYVMKPFNPVELQARVKSQIRDTCLAQAIQAQESW